jgi:hypothetical protein
MEYKRVMPAFLVLILLSAIPLASSQSGGRNILLLMDVSDSMDESINMGRKIDIAKDAMTDVVNSLSGVNLGIRIFPADSFSCYSSLISDISPIDIKKTTLLTQIDDLYPRGYTPIEQSLRDSQSDFSMYGSKEIILVSDGEETCDGDPCTAILDLRAQGFDITVHTIGFDISDEGRNQLLCISQATGGNHYDASDKESLMNAMSQAVHGGGNDWLWIVLIIVVVVIVLVVVLLLLMHSKGAAAVPVASTAVSTTPAAAAPAAAATAATAATAAAFCPSCGASLPQGSAFCPGCGAKAPPAA